MLRLSTKRMNTMFAPASVPCGAWTRIVVLQSPTRIQVWRSLAHDHECTAGIEQQASIHDFNQCSEPGCAHCRHCHGAHFSVEVTPSPTLTAYPSQEASYASGSASSELSAPPILRPTTAHCPCCCRNVLFHLFKSILVTLSAQCALFLETGLCLGDCSQESTSSGG